MGRSGRARALVLMPTQPSSHRAFGLARVSLALTIFRASRLPLALARPVLPVLPHCRAHQGKRPCPRLVPWAPLSGIARAGRQSPRSMTRHLGASRPAPHRVPWSSRVPGPPHQLSERCARGKRRACLLRGAGRASRGARARARPIAPAKCSLLARPVRRPTTPLLPSPSPFPFLLPFPQLCGSWLCSRADALPFPRLWWSLRPLTRPRLRALKLRPCLATALRAWSTLGCPSCTRFGSASAPKGAQSAPPWGAARAGRRRGADPPAGPAHLRARGRARAPTASARASALGLQLQGSTRIPPTPLLGIAAPGTRASPRA